MGTADRTNDRLEWKRSFALVHHLFDRSGWFSPFRLVVRRFSAASILQSSPNSEKRPSAVSLDHERREGIGASNSKQIIYVRADQLLNITLTKTGLDLVQRLSALFNDVYNKRLPMIDDDDQPMLSLINWTGRDIAVGNFDGVEVRQRSRSETNIFRFLRSDRPTSVATVVRSPAEPIDRTERAERTSILGPTLGDRRTRFSST